MPKQRSLFDEEPTFRERFLRFHAENPHVWKLFVQFARQLKDTGRRRGGARMIWERIRWESAITTRDADWKLNDHFIAHYARKLMDEYPAEFEGFFETRALKRL